MKASFPGRGWYWVPLDSHDINHHFLIKDPINPIRASSALQHRSGSPQAWRGVGPNLLWLEMICEKPGLNHQEYELMIQDPSNSGFVCCF